MESDLTFITNEHDNNLKERPKVLMSSPPVTSVSVTDEARAFLEFHYVEIKDLTKQFLTVVAAVLALSVTFSEKIVNFSQAGMAQRFLMILTWGLCLLAVILGGCAIYFIFNAGIAAKATVLYGELKPYRTRTRLSYLCLYAAGISFVIALFLLVLIVLLRMFSK